MRILQKNERAPAAWHRAIAAAKMDMGVMTPAGLFWRRRLLGVRRVLHFWLQAQAVKKNEQQEARQNLGKQAGVR